MIWASNVILVCTIQLLSPRCLASTIPKSLAQLLNLEISSNSVFPPGLRNLSTPADNCFTDTLIYKPTTVATCKPLLDQLRRFVNFNEVQRFEKDKYPRKPQTPPFLFVVKHATCAMALLSNGKVDNFSWRNVREKATEIVEDCQPNRGLGIGGWDHVGPKRNWVVEMRGVTPGGGLLEHVDWNTGIMLSEDVMFYPLSMPPVAPIEAY